jgi:hypothetical protein
MKYVVSTKKELIELSKVLTWNEIFESCTLSSDILSAALAMSMMAEVEVMDSMIQKNEFLIEYLNNEIA